MQKPSGLRRAILCVAGVATSMSIAGSALASSCATPVEIRAFQTRMLQTDLMLAALACGESDRYNQFIRKYTPELTSGGDVMRGYFKRAYGAQGATRMNAVMTQYANNASQDRWSVGDNYYCAKAGEKFVAVLQSQGAQEMLQQASAGPNARRHGLVECGVTTASAPAVKPAVKPAVATASATKAAVKPAAAPAKKKDAPPKQAAAKETKVAAKAVAQRQ